MPGLGRMLVVAGLILLLTGAFVMLLGRFDLPLGRLPGDITLRGRKTSFYFPVISCLLLSALVSLVLWLAGRFRR